MGCYNKYNMNKFCSIRSNFFSKNTNDSLKKNENSVFFIITLLKSKKREFKKHKNVFIKKKMKKNDDMDKNNSTESYKYIEILKKSIDIKKNELKIKLDEIGNEIDTIDWPNFDRLFKQFVLVIISVVISAFIIYSVDGVFAWSSRIFFNY